MKEKKECLEKCRRVLTDKGGVMSRAQLTEILVKLFERSRPTVATYISEWLKDGSLVQVNGMIQLSNELAMPF